MPGEWQSHQNSAEHCLLVMIEKLKEAIDRGNEFGAPITDLSKAFDCINHPPLNVKLYNYGVSPLSVNMSFPIWAITHIEPNQWMLHWEI